MRDRDLEASRSHAGVGDWVQEGSDRRKGRRPPLQGIAFFHCIRPTHLGFHKPMELRHIRYFIRAAELLHFTRAAESLYVSQPTLSIHIQQLEEELGALLFERAGRHARPVRLTEAGHRLLKHLRNALRELELGKEDVAELRGLVSGTLRFGSTHVFSQRLVSTALSVFTAKYPEIHIVMKLGTSTDIEQAILERDTDLGLAF